MTAMLLWSMILTVLIFAGSLVMLIAAAVLYVPLLCYIQGNLKVSAVTVLIHKGIHLSFRTLTAGIRLSQGRQGEYPLTGYEIPADLSESPRSSRRNNASGSPAKKRWNANWLQAGSRIRMASL